MRKIYTTDIGTKVFFGLFATFIITGSIYLLFLYKGPKSIFKVLSTIIFAIMCIWWFIDLLFFKVIIEEDKISSKIRFFSFLNRYWSLRWSEILKVNATGGIFFEEFAEVVIYPKDFGKKKFNKFLSIPIGFGLPYEVLQDILPHIPKDATVKIEPFLLKYLHGKPRIHSSKKLILIALLLILMVIGGFILSWFSAFHK